MAFDRITDGDLLGKGNLGRPDTPGVDTAEMQRILDELPREVIVPAFNRLADQLEASDAAASLGAVPPESLPEDTPATVQGVLEAALNKNDEHIGRTDNPHAVTAAQTGAYTKEETDAAISQRVTEIGAGDMARAVYDPTGQKRDVFAAIGEAVAGAGHMEKSVYAAAGEPGAVDRALRADSALAADDGVKVYTHTKSGTVHNFAGSGANGRAKLTADVQAGDTFTVNGVPVAAYVGADSAADAMAGGAWNGRWVSFTVEGGTLNFKGAAGGLKPGQLVILCAQKEYQNLNPKTYKYFDSPYFTEGVCSKKCTVIFYASVGYNASANPTVYVYKNGQQVLSKFVTDADTAPEMGTVECFPDDKITMGYTISNNSGSGSIFGILA